MGGMLNSQKAQAFSYKKALGCNVQNGSHSYKYCIRCHHKFGENIYNLLLRYQTYPPKNTQEFQGIEDQKPNRKMNR